MTCTGICGPCHICVHGDMWALSYLCARGYVGLVIFVCTGICGPCHICVHGDMWALSYLCARGYVGLVIFVCMGICGPCHICVHGDMWALSYLCARGYVGLVIFVCTGICGPCHICVHGGMWVLCAQGYVGPVCTRMIVYCVHTHSHIPHAHMPPYPFHAVKQEQACSTVVYCAAHPSMENIGGLYMYECLPAEPSGEAQDPSTGAALWELSERIIAEKTAVSL